MEENSEAHMETDVSSTTDDVPEKPQVPSSHSDIEMVVVIEAVKEEEESSADPGSSTPSTSTNSSPQKPSTPQKAINSTMNESDISKKVFLNRLDTQKLKNNPQITVKMSPVKQQPESSDSSKRSDITISPGKTLEKTVVKSPVLQQLAILESSNSAKRSEITISPGKMIEKTVGKSPVMQQPESSNSSKRSEITISPGKTLERTVGKSPVKIQQESSNFLKRSEITISPGKMIEKTVEKSPVKESPALNVQNPQIKDIKVARTPIKLIRIRHHEKPLNNDVSVLGKSPPKDIQNKPDREVTLLKISNKEVNLPEKSATIETLQGNSSRQETVTEKSPIDANSKEMEPKAINLPETTLVKDKVEEVPKMEVDAEITNQDNDPGSKEDKVQDSEEKVSSNKLDVSQSSTTEKAQDINTCIPENKTQADNERVTTDISSLPADESQTTDLNTSQTSMEVVKDHNKSISRELKSLMNSAKESKIISACTQLTSKTRKSRSQLDISNTSLNTSLDADKISIRRISSNSQVSNCSEQSEKGLKRSMRSRNSDFASKCKQSLNSVLSSKVKDSGEAMSDDENAKSAEKADTSLELSNSTPPSPKKKKVFDQPVLGGKKRKSGSDAYCWRCHWTVEQENNKAHPPMSCTVCPRSFHYKCLSGNERKTTSENSWVCPDCIIILQAEGSDTRSPAMKKTSLGMLCDLLKYALERMMDLNGVEPFLQPVDRTAFPEYDKYVVHPMDLSQMKQNIAEGLYGSTEAFVADVQWILHNSIIFNTCEQAFLQSKLTGGARALVRSCRAEMSEIEACPECYAAAHARRPTWFTDVCTTPHILLWAKLKGFPHWPAKGMSVNNSGLVDVRFFGAHDRAWVPAKDCFLFSETDPNNFRSKRQDILDSMQEAEQHIRNISRKYGKFVYQPFKTPFDPSKLTEQLKMMIPSFEGEVRMPISIKEKSRTESPQAKIKRRSKRSKSTACEGDGSDSEDMSTSARTAAIKTTKVEPNEKTSTEKVAKVDSSMVDEPFPAADDFILTRKRRRSILEEARVMTVVGTSQIAVEKKKKIEPQEPSSSKEDETRSISPEDAESKSKKKTETPKAKDEEPSSSTQDEKETLRVTPIKLVALPRPNKQTPKIFTATKVASTPTSPKEEDKTPQKPKPSKPSTSEKHKEDKTKRRRNSRASRSFNNSTSSLISTRSTDTEGESDTASKKEQKPKESKKNDTDTESIRSASSLQSKGSESPRSVKDRLTFDDDTSLAIIARERRRSNANLPTISSVCSLSTTAEAALTTSTSTTSSAPLELTVEASSNSSIFTPTNTEMVRNMKEAVSKLQKLRDNTEPVVGRVGVRSFARMTSPGRPTSPKRPDNMEVEIKAEPIDLEEDVVRLNEKMDLMTACKLQPVGQVQNLRDVRISRVIGSVPSVPGTAKKPEARSRARKTFPQSNEVRSELNGKNSMVYIPIQPPATQAPVRATRPAQVLRVNAPVPASGNNTVNTVTTPLKPPPTLSSPPTITVMSKPTVGQVSLPTLGQANIPTVGQVPTTVHKVPLMTSVNGQWMFSLQPVMSVGSVDNPSSSLMVNGTTSSVMTLSSASIVNSTPPAAANRTASDNATAEMSRLPQRPALVHPLDPGSSSSTPVPASAGSHTAKLQQNAQKLTDFFRTLIEDTIEKLDDPVSTATSLRLQLEQSRWRHKQEVEELRHNHELTLAEMRLSFEKDKMRLAGEARRAAQIELEVAVKLAKSKQWCAQCYQEAQFYCCWNTAYCDYPCQRAHWPLHYSHCAQKSKPSKFDHQSKPQDTNVEESRAIESRVQPLPDVLPALQKSSPAQSSALTVGGKLTTRVFPPQDGSAQKASIIVSMVEDNSGNQTMKCVGTYKPVTQPGQIPSLLVNKQAISEETAKKVVTSGGYLIVGAGNTASIITPAQARRPNTIQYFS